MAQTAQDVLEDNGVEDDDVAHIVGLLASLKDDVVQA